MYNYDEELNKIPRKEIHDLFGVEYNDNETKNINNNLVSIKISVIEKDKEYIIELDKNLLLENLDIEKIKRVEE